MLRGKFGEPLENGWKAQGDWKPNEVRFFLYWLKRFWRQESIFINSFAPLSLVPYFGVPCGGIRSGCLGRDFRGAFCKYTLRPGLVEYHVVNIPENQFIVNIRRGEKTLYQRILTAVPKKHNKLKAWDFTFPAKNLHYVGLFPRSWTIYTIPEHNLTLCCRQVSPVFPHNYQDTCLPVTVFHWTIENSGHEPLEVSICFTFRNGTGDSRWSKEGPCRASPIKFVQQQRDVEAGIQLEHTINGMACTYGLAAERRNDVEITYDSFDVTKDGSDLWNQLFQWGRLSQRVRLNNNRISNELGVAISCRTTIEPRERKCFKTCVAWHMPKVWFGKKVRIYKKRYTKWFNSASEICQYALENLENWERRIDEWQDPIICAKNWPLMFKNALINELYYFVDGGTVWFDYDETWRMDEPYLSDYTCNLLKDYGRFAYLESFEYKMYTTYDVHFYSSFAFSCLFPRIQQCIQAEYCDQIENEDRRVSCFFYSGDRGFVKQKFRVPHDLGCPGCEPWIEINSYLAHNTAEWKDLNLKFILTSMRDYLTLKNFDEQKEFLGHVWPKVKLLIDVARHEWDTDGDCMIENSGTCDQTYDTWKMSGTSAYCGSLWLSALQCGAKMAQIMEEFDLENLYKDILSKAKVAFHKKLWMGDYYRFDQNSSDSDAIMADQLCGFWYLSTCGLQENVLHPDHVKTALRKIHEHNVLKFGDGKLGAVNGRYPFGTADKTSMQAEEVWTGVTYALSALMIDQGMINEGLSMASAVNSAVFGSLGMQFQSPEAIYEHKCYRALGYMRSLSIWSIYWMQNRESLTQVEP